MTEIDLIGVVKRVNRDIQLCNEGTIPFNSLSERWAQMTQREKEEFLLFALIKTPARGPVMKIENTKAVVRAIMLTGVSFEEGVDSKLERLAPFVVKPYLLGQAAVILKRSRRPFVNPDMVTVQYILRLANSQEPLEDEAISTAFTDTPATRTGITRDDLHVTAYTKAVSSVVWNLVHEDSPSTSGRNMIFLQWAVWLMELGKRYMLHSRLFWECVFVMHAGGIACGKQRCVHVYRTVIHVLDLRKDVISLLLSADACDEQQVVCDISAKTFTSALLGMPPEVSRHSSCSTCPLALKALCLLCVGQVCCIPPARCRCWIERMGGHELLMRMLSGHTEPGGDTDPEVVISPETYACIVDELAYYPAEYSQSERQQRSDTLDKALFKSMGARIRYECAKNHRLFGVPRKSVWEKRHETAECLSYHFLKGATANKQLVKQVIQEFVLDCPFLPRNHSFNFTKKAAARLKLCIPETHALLSPSHTCDYGRRMRGDAGSPQEQLSEDNTDHGSDGDSGSE
jgi:hypothetical protein